VISIHPPIIVEGFRHQHKLSDFLTQDTSMTAHASVVFPRAMSLGLILLSAACGGGDGGNGPDQTPVASIEIDPTLVELPPGGTRQLTWTLKDADGNTLSGRIVKFTTTNGGAATVSTRGLISAIGVGNATITATSEGQSATATVTVALLPVATVHVTPATANIGAGLAGQLSAVALSAGGDTLTGRTISWSSSDDNIATVSPTGLVSGVASGPATISATSEGVVGTAAVTIGLSLAFPAADGGFSHTCSLTSNGEAYCWGLNTDGQLGNGVQSASSAVPILVSGGVHFSSLIPGASHTCGMTAGGTAYCWGRNSEGQAGLGASAGVTVPTAVLGGVVFTSLTGGFNNTCGTVSTGAAYCWGSNVQGAVGDGTTSKRTVPTAVVGGLTFTSISARGAHACGLVASGAAYCWGSNDQGEIGDGTTTDRTVPTLVAGGLSFTEITTGGAHTCARTSAGAAYCWGMNDHGEVGDNSTTDRPTPVAVQGGIVFQSIRARGNHTCGLTAAGAAYCWGENTSGELGDNSTTNRDTPALVSGGFTFTAVSSGSNFTCGITNAPLLYCWGNNQFGQLGNGTFANSKVPAKVLGQP
jgi:alpha-tubulin suppressor-like RCC1 family protein